MICSGGRSNAAVSEVVLVLAVWRDKGRRRARGELDASWCGGGPESEGVVRVAEASRGVLVAGKFCGFCKGGQRVSEHVEGK